MKRIDYLDIAKGYLLLFVLGRGMLAYDFIMLGSLRKSLLQSEKANVVI